MYYENEMKGQIMFHEVPQVPLDVDFGGTLKFNGDCAKASMIDAEDLLGESTTHAGRIVFWGAMAAEATYTVATQKQLLKTVRASRYEEQKQIMIDSGDKVTEAAIGNKLEQDEAVISAEADLAKTVADSEKVKSVYEAMKHRKDLILTVNRLITAAGEDDPREYEKPPVRRRAN